MARLIGCSTLDELNQLYIFMDVMLIRVRYTEIEQYIELEMLFIK